MRLTFGLSLMTLAALACGESTAPTAPGQSGSPPLVDLQAAPGTQSGKRSVTVTVATNTWKNLSTTDAAINTVFTTGAFCPDGTVAVGGGIKLGYSSGVGSFIDFAIVGFGLNQNNGFSYSFRLTKANVLVDATAYANCLSL